MLLHNYLLTFEKTQVGSGKIINLNKLLTSILLLSPQLEADRNVSFLYHEYNPSHGIEGMRRSQLKQMLDHVFFTVIYAIPNLAYHYAEAGYTIESEKCDQVM